MDDLPVQVACRVLGVSESGFYEQRNRPPSERAIRHAMLTDLITQIHTESNGTYGIQRVHAELTLGRGVQVGHNQVELLMRRAGLQLSGAGRGVGRRRIGTFGSGVSAGASGTTLERVWAGHPPQLAQAGPS